MKRNLLCAAMVLIAGSIMADSSSKDEIKSAAAKLGAADNYSWKTTTANNGGGGGGNFRPGPTVGKTQKDGLTLVSFTFGDNTTETVLQGGKGAIKTEDGWKSLDEAAEDQQGPGRMARRLKTFKAPAAQIEELVADTKDLAKTDNVYSGELTEEGAKTLMRFGGRRGNGNGPAITGAKGTVKIWVADGAVTKFQVNVKGTITVNGEDRDIDRTTTTEISEIGKTKVEPSDEAKKKMS